jgi:hypothetical protein
MARPWRALVAALGCTLCLAGAGVGRAQTSRTLEVRWDVDGEPLVLRSNAGFAGAVSSLRFRGVEHLDAADHGRLLQGAISFDAHGECLNPTQAGSSSDKPGRSTSRLLSASLGPTGYRTITRMAYWLRPRQSCGAIRGEPGQP